MNEALIVYSGSGSGEKQRNQEGYIQTSEQQQQQQQPIMHYKGCSGGKFCACRRKPPISKNQTPPPLTRDPRRKKKHHHSGHKQADKLSPVSSFHKSRRALEPIIEPPDEQYLSRNIQSQSRQEVTAFWKVASLGAVIGGIGGLVLALVFILVAKIQMATFPHDVSTWFLSNGGIMSPSCSSDETCPLPFSAIRGRTEQSGVQAYLDLFGRKKEEGSAEQADISRNAVGGEADTTSLVHRHLIQRRTSKTSPKLVIAGKMSVEDGPCNIAQFNLATHEWSLKARIQLSLYNSYSGGEVYSLLANHTSELSLSKSRPDHGRYVLVT